MSVHHCRQIVFPEEIENFILSFVLTTCEIRDVFEEKLGLNPQISIDPLWDIYQCAHQLVIDTEKDNDISLLPLHAIDILKVKKSSLSISRLLFYLNTTRLKCLEFCSNNHELSLKYVEPLPQPLDFVNIYSNKDEYNPNLSKIIHSILSSKFRPSALKLYCLHLREFMKSNYAQNQYTCVKKLISKSYVLQEKDIDIFRTFPSLKIFEVGSTRSNSWIEDIYHKLCEEAGRDCTINVYYRKILQKRYEKRGEKITCYILDGSSCSFRIHELCYLIQNDRKIIPRKTLKIYGSEGAERYSIIDPELKIPQGTFLEIPKKLEIARESVIFSNMWTVSDKHRIIMLSVLKAFTNVKKCICTSDENPTNILGVLLHVQNLELVYTYTIPTLALENSNMLRNVKKLTIYIVNPRNELANSIDEIAKKIEKYRQLTDLVLKFANSPGEFFGYLCKRKILKWMFTITRLSQVVPNIHIIVKLQADIYTSEEMHEKTTYDMVYSQCEITRQFRAITNITFDIKRPMFTSTDISKNINIFTVLRDIYFA